MDLPGQPRLIERATTFTTALSPPRVALAIGAHPDDVEFGAGGTLAKWAAAGTTVHHLVCTDGSKGTWDVNADTAALVLRRQHEQRGAASALGAAVAGDQVHFLGWPDGELDSGLRQRWQVAYWIRRLQPEVVLGHDPWRRYRLHPDHRHAGYLTVDGIVAARDPHFFPEQALPPHRPMELLLWEADLVDHYEDVDGWVDQKLAALLCHESQFESTMGGSSADELQQFGQRIRDRLAEQGRLVGLSAVEGFKRMNEL